MGGFQRYLPVHKKLYCLFGNTGLGVRGLRCLRYQEMMMKIAVTARGRGRSMRMASGATIPPSGPVQPGNLMSQMTTGPVRPKQELDILKARAQEINTQLKAIHDRINQIEQGSSVSALVAAVDADKCTACGVCQHVCPTGAITLGEVARIGQEKCTACGRCVAECPQGAITLKMAS